MVYFADMINKEKLKNPVLVKVEDYYKQENFNKMPEYLFDILDEAYAKGIKHVYLEQKEIDLFKK